MQDWPAELIGLLRLAQSGQPEVALARVDEALAARQDLGMLYVRAVALHFLGDHQRAAGAAEVMLALTSDGAGIGARSEPVPSDHANATAAWRTVALSFRACQHMLLSEADPQAFDLELTLHDLAQAEALLTEEGTHGFVLATAHTGVGHGYHDLRLYELAGPHYAAAFEAAVDAASTAPGEAAVETAVTSQLNLAEMHLNWSVELRRVGDVAGAREQAGIAAAHAGTARAHAVTTGTQAYAAHAALFAACARASSDSDGPIADRIRTALAGVEGRASRDLRAFALPFLARALDRAGEHAEALEVAAAGCAALPEDASWLLGSAAYHVQAILLARSGADSALAGLAYGDQLAKAMWRQRLRTLHNARSMLYLERVTLERDRIHVLAHTDALTGVGNRRAFDVRVAELGRVAGEVDGVALIIVDVDRLKAVNDSGGHAAGDLALQAVATALSSEVRAGDLVARIGGDEFVAVIAGMDHARASALAARVVEAVPSALGPEVTVSVGVAVGPPSEVRDGLLPAADREMYAAKRSGRAMVTARERRDVTAGRDSEPRESPA